MTAVVEDILAGEQRESGAADLMLQTAEWAAAAFSGFDRGRVGTLLRTKEAVESGIASGADGADLVAPMDALIAATDTALADIGIEVDPCDG